MRNQHGGFFAGYLSSVCRLVISQASALDDPGYNAPYIRQGGPIACPLYAPSVVGRFAATDKHPEKRQGKGGERAKRASLALSVAGCIVAA